MNFQEFCKKASAWEEVIDKDKSIEFVFNMICCKHFYHVIVHYTAFESFLSKMDEGMAVFNFSIFWNKDHVHFFAHSKKFLRNSEGIMVVPIKHPEQKDYIERNFFHCFEKKHNSTCKFSFDDSLTNACMRKILDHTKDVDQLGLPRIISEKLLNLNKLYFQPQHCKNYALFCAKKYTYKDIDIDNLMFTWPKCVSFDFVTHDYKIVKLCQDCMLSEIMFKRKYTRTYGLRIILNFYTDYFCHECEQIPVIPALEIDPYHYWYLHLNEKTHDFFYHIKYIVYHFKKLPDRKTYYFLCESFIMNLYLQYRNQVIKKYIIKKGSFFNFQCLFSFLKNNSLSDINSTGK